MLERFPAENVERAAPAAVSEGTSEAKRTLAAEAATVSDQASAQPHAETPLGAAHTELAHQLEAIPPGRSVQLNVPVIGAVMLGRDAEGKYSIQAGEDAHVLVRGIHASGQSASEVAGDLGRQLTERARTFHATASRFIEQARSDQQTRDQLASAAKHGAEAGLRGGVGIWQLGRAALLLEESPVIALMLLALGVKEMVEAADHGHAAIESVTSGVPRTSSRLGEAGGHAAAELLESLAE